MNVTFHEIESFFVNLPLQGESYLEVKSIIEMFMFKKSTLKNLSLKKSIMKQERKVDTIESNTKGPIPISQQVQLSKSKVSILKNPTEEVTNDMPISILKIPLGRLLITCLLVSLRIPLRPKDKRVIGCRWIYIVMCKYSETLGQYKARLVIKGYTQIYGIDYEETFVFVAKMNIIRIILSLNLKQFDVKIFFLHEDLEEEAYMEIPPRFYSHDEKNKSQSDHTFFIKHSLNGKLILCLVFVGDMIILDDDEIDKLTLKEKLTTQFEMKEKYVLDLVKEIGKLGCKTSRVLIEQNHRTECEESPTIEKSQYQRLVRKLIYLSHTRPNIAYVISVASLRKELLFRREGTLSMIYTDVNYERSITDRRSTSKYYMFLGVNLVIWRSKKRNMVVWSSVEAKFQAMRKIMDEDYS
ncbi:hypothetical protein CR513_51526, partial [Mucuna pruriens]